MLFRALFTQRQAPRFAVEPFDFRALPPTTTMATATVGVGLFHAANIRKNGELFSHLLENIFQAPIRFPVLYVLD